MSLGYSSSGSLNGQHKASSALYGSPTFQQDMEKSQHATNYKEALIPNLSTYALNFGSSGTWNVTCQEDMVSLHQILKSNDSQIKQELVRSLIPFIGPKKEFRTQLDLMGTPYLVAFFPLKKEVNVYTARMNRELFLLHNLNPFHLPNAWKGSFQQFKLYVERCLAINLGDSPTAYEIACQRYHLKNLLDAETNKDYLDICQQSEKKINALLVHLNEYNPSFFEKISDFALGLTAQYLLLRLHLLKFLAILPGLDHDKKGTEVKRILLESLRRLLEDSESAKRNFKIGQERALPDWLFKILWIFDRVASKIPAGLLAFGVRTAVKFMAKRFIAGESIEKAASNFRAVFKTHRQVTLDQLGELVVSDKEAENYKQQVIKLINGFSLYVEPGEKNFAGINKAHVSIKVSALSAQFKPEAFEFTYQQVAPRLKEILIAAKNKKVFINIDAEHYHYRDLVFDIYRKVLLETTELANFQETGIVLQAYLRDAAAHLEDIIRLAQTRKLTMPIRLVKGAYWDAETVEGRAHNYHPPEFLNKEETDLNFRSLIYRMFAQYPHVQLCLAGHNFADHCFAEELREKTFAHLPPIEHQCLHMTYEALSVAMAKMGWVVRNYVPIGNLLVGMGYLVRRIMENSSQVGVLTIMRSHKKKSSLARPDELLTTKIKQGDIERDLTEAALTEDFLGATPFRPYIPEQREEISRALTAFKKNELGQNYQNAFGLTGEDVSIISSSDPTLIVGRLKFANVGDAERALAHVEKSFNEDSSHWLKSGALTRASVLLRTAVMMLSRRSDLSALIMYEAGKSLKEAYGDVDEAVDFLNFYAREEVRLAKERGELWARGPAAVISPWNFPLAIPAGMVTSALVTGCPVILKSAEQTPLIAQVLVDLLHTAGVPKEVLIHLPGQGEVVGAALVESFKIAAYVFTGSMSVGTMIGRKVGHRLYHSSVSKLTYPVKVITEMGGKNAVIVTPNAELDETVSGILQSAFGHAGQKCSALSRVLVHETLKDKLLERLREACATIQVGAAFDFSTFINPLITAEDQKRVRRQVEEAAEEAKMRGGKVWVNRCHENLPGFCVGPVVIELPKDALKDVQSFSRRELFAPVLHVLPFRDLDEAIKLFNSTDYALTGGIFCQSQDDIDHCLESLEAGNLYVNRGITGARVGIEPFGGFKLSGTGPKAGGSQYLDRFHLYPVNNPLLEELAVRTPADENFGHKTHHLARPSQMSFRRRLPRIVKTVEEIINHYEYFYQGIYGENKHHLTKFKKYLNDHASDFYFKGIKNHVIPGQLSLNNFNLGSGRVLVAAYEKRAHFSTLMEVLGALAMGAGVTVLCRNSEALKFWNLLHHRFLTGGGSNENFVVDIASEKDLVELAQLKEVEVVVIDGDLDRVTTVWKALCQNTNLGTKKLLSPFDGPSVDDYQRFLEEFTLVRSLAINTMRHGAPLNLED